MTFVAALAICYVAAAPPTVRSIRPPSVERGTVARVTIDGADLGPATRVVCFPRPEQKLVSATDSQAVVEIRMPDDAPTGVTPLFVVNADGVSEPFPFVVGSLPEIALQPPAPGRSQKLRRLPLAVCGTLGEKETALFEFEGRKGDRIVAEVLAQRMGSALDPTLTLLDSAERPLRISEDEPGLEQDCRIVALLPSDGVYRLKLHDAVYGPGGRFRLAIGDLPVVRQVFPAGGRRGSRISAEIELDGAKDVLTESILMTDASRRNRALLSSDLLKGADATGVWLDVDEAADVDESAKQPFAVPSAVNGHFRGGAETTFTFRCKPGDRLSVEVRSAALGWATDPSLRCTAGGKTLAADDDVLRAPAQIEKTFRKDSSDSAATFVASGPLFQVTVWDLMRTQLPYRLVVAPAGPEFDLRPAQPGVLVRRERMLSVPILVRRGELKGPIEIRLDDEAIKAGWAVRGDGVAAGPGLMRLVLKLPRDLSQPTRLRLYGVAQSDKRAVRMPVHYEAVWRQTRDVVQQSWDLPYVLVVPHIESEAPVRPGR